MVEGLREAEPLLRVLRTVDWLNAAMQRLIG